MDIKKQEQMRAAAQLEISIWDALIGAQGSPAVQNLLFNKGYMHLRVLL